MNAFKACEPKFMEVPTDDGGMIMEELEKIPATTERVKMIMSSPISRIPPAAPGIWSAATKFMDIVNKYEIPVVEDNPPTASCASRVSICPL